MIRQLLSDAVARLVKDTFDIECVLPAIEMPKNPSYGDFATNVAFSLTKTLRRPPMVIADSLCEAAKSHDLFRGMVCAPLNGFVNIKLSDDWIWAKSIQWSPDVVAATPNPKRILLEYVSANPTGPLHIGHGRWAIIGSCLHQLLSRVGHQVTSEFYVNDAGNQIQLFRDSVTAVREGNPVPEGGYHGVYIKDLVDAKDPVEAMRSAHEATLGRIGVHFDRWFSEQTLHADGAVARAIQRLRDVGTVYEADNAIWFRSTDFGDDKDRVLVKNDGAYTYFAVDCAYHFNKLGRAGHLMVNIWGADHHGYVSRVRAMVQALGGADWAADDRFKVIIGQLVTLLKAGQPVRMSKRTGEMVTLDEIVDDIGQDATRFFLAMKSSDSAIDFDLEVAKKKSNENPVFYVQYAHARICAIYRKLGVDAPTTATLQALNESERAVLLSCIQFQDEIHGAAAHFAPHRIVYYLIEMARLVHGMYENSPILGTAPELQIQRLWILETARSCLRAGLSLIGVSAPTEM